MSSRSSVLVVDDHPVVIDGIRRLLAEEPDFTMVGEATNGDDGVALAKSLLPDVVVLDLKLGDNFAPTSAARCAKCRVILGSSFTLLLTTVNHFGLV